MRPTPFASLVSAGELAGLLGGDDLVVLDVRVALTAAGPVAARDRFEAAHIPGAVLADLPGELCDASRPIAFALPTPEAFCAAMGRLGVGDESRVVLYDACQTTPTHTFASIWAARAWWSWARITSRAGRRCTHDPATSAEP